MTIRIWDTFTGAAAVSLASRVPDGGLDVTAAVGTWAHVTGTNTGVGVGTVNGIRGAVRATGVGSSSIDSHYVVTGVTLPEAHTVQATATFLNSPNDQWFALLMDGNTTDPECYECRLDRQGLIELFYVDSAATELLLASTVTDVLPSLNVAYTLSLGRVGSELVVALNSAILLTVTDTTLLTGAPGLCLLNDVTITQGVVCTDWRVFDEEAGGGGGELPRPPCASALPQAVYAQDGFDGPDGNIVHRLLDGGSAGDCLAQGEWAETKSSTSEPVPDSYLYVVDNEARFIAPGPTLNWRHDVVTNIANLGEDYSVECTFVIPVAGDLNDVVNVQGREVWVALLARHSDVTETGYEALLSFIPGVVGTGGYLIDVYRLTNGVISILTSNTYRPGELAEDVEHTLRFCIAGNGFCVYLNGSLIATTSDPNVIPLSGGYPGLCIYDGQRSVLLGVHQGFTVQVRNWKVVSDEPGAPVCAGGGGHIPPTGGGATEAFLWGFQQGAHRPAPAPDAANLIRVQGHRHGVKRQIKKAWGMANGAWRTPAVGGSDSYDGPDGPYNGDPGDTFPDPGCGQIPTGSPSLPVPPPGEKIFAAWELPFSGAVAPFDTGFNEMGGHTPGRLLEAQAAGLRYIGAQGGYTKFRDGSGNYSPSVMNAWIAGFASMDTFLYDMFDAGVFYGVSVADDIRNTKPLNGWPPSGLSATEVNRIAGVWKAQHPWIRTLVRTHPSVLINAGATPGMMTNLDATISQYAFLYGDIDAWVAQQEGIRATLGIPYNLWSLNYYEGDGRSGVRTEVREEIVRPRYFMAPSEIDEYGAVLAAAYSGSLGIGGWKINTTFLNIPGVVDALIRLKTLMLTYP